MELIATQPGIKSVDEPLFPSNLAKAHVVSSKNVDDWNFLMPHPERKAGLKAYFEAISNNQIHIGEPPLFSRFYRLSTNRIVFKLLRAKDLIPWFEDAFGWQIVYLLRHPLATNLSRKSFPRLPMFLSNEEFVAEYLTADQLQFSREILATGTPLQKGVLDWCLQNIPAIRRLNSSSWTLVFYENLITQSEHEISRLSSALALPAPERMAKSLNQASVSTVQSDSGTREAFESKTKPTKKFLLGKWRKKVSDEEERLAFDVAHQFNIHYYVPGSDLPVQSDSPFGSNGDPAKAPLK